MSQTRHATASSFIPLELFALILLSLSKSNKNVTRYSCSIPKSPLAGVMNIKEKLIKFWSLEAVGHVDAWYNRTVKLGVNSGAPMGRVRIYNSPSLTPTFPSCHIYPRRTLIERKILALQ